MKNKFELEGKIVYDYTEQFYMLDYRDEETNTRHVFPIRLNKELVDKLSVGDTVVVAGVLEMLKHRVHLRCTAVETIEAGRFVKG